MRFFYSSYSSVRWFSTFFETNTRHIDSTFINGIDFIRVDCAIMMTPEFCKMRVSHMKYTAFLPLLVNKKRYRTISIWFRIWNQRWFQIMMQLPLTIFVAGIVGELKLVYEPKNTSLKILLSSVIYQSFCLSFCWRE